MSRGMKKHPQRKLLNIFYMYKKNSIMVFTH